MTRSSPGAGRSSSSARSRSPGSGTGSPGRPGGPGDVAGRPRSRGSSAPCSRCPCSSAPARSCCRPWSARRCAAGAPIGRDRARVLTVVLAAPMPIALLVVEAVREAALTVRSVSGPRCCRDLHADRRQHAVDRRPRRRRLADATAPFGSSSWSPACSASSMIAMFTVGIATAPTDPNHVGRRDRAVPTEEHP